MAFGPLGRAWQPRVGLAGTYDKHWRDNVCPFLPEDFDDRYFQAGPPNQQMSHPIGGEVVELLNLTPVGQTIFRLPSYRVSMIVWPRRRASHEVVAALDTIVIEPEQRRVILVWRSFLALRKNIFEVLRASVSVRQRQPGDVV
jgi:hypothetical protein